MTTGYRDDLRRNFPKTAIELDKRFSTEADCRAYWIVARWGETPRCRCCDSMRVWMIRDSTTFECADCRHRRRQCRWRSS
jgi:hypothetical protein